MELGAGLLVVPIIQGELADIDVQSFGDQWTGGDGAVGPIGALVLPMAFEEDTGVDRVELTNASQVEVSDDGIEDIVKWSWPASPAFK